MSPTPRSTRSRPEPAAVFFEDLASRKHDARLHHATGTVRIDLRDDAGIEHWYVTMAKGDVSISRRNAKADSVVRMDKKLFEGMVKGSVNFNAALLRGVLEVEGDIGLFVAFERLLPGPAQSRASFLERQEELTR
ncbi:MAG: SCP2 sterol-binding domain-containing protein [Acidimicrobiales bacterium]